MSKQERLILITSVLGTNDGISTEEGKQIFELIDAALSNGFKAKISFKNINLITTTFLNASFGQLYSKYTSEQLREAIEVIDITQADKSLLGSVLIGAKEYFNNKAAMDKALQEDEDDN